MFKADQPIETQKDDILERAHFAEALAEAILKYKSKESLSIGLYGKWGSGKTSIINMMLEEIESRTGEYKKIEKPIIVQFNPWNFSDQNQLISQFFSILSTKLNRKDTAEEHKKVGKLIQKYARLFKPLEYAPRLDIIGKFFKAINDIGEGLKKAGEEETKNLLGIKQEIDQILYELSSKIIIIIDDIDRLTSTEIRQIFQLVKSSADFPNTIYLLSFDLELVGNALNKVQEGDGKAYIEKIIQVPFEVPEIQEEDIGNYLSERINYLMKGVPGERWVKNDAESIYQTVLKHMIKNIRDANRFINTLSFGFPLVKDEVYPTDFIAITAIQVFLPEMYSRIKASKNRMFDNTPFPGLLSESEKMNDKSIIDDMIGDEDKISQRIPQKSLENIIKMLFPNISDDNRGFLENWRKKGRICAPEVFDTYFLLTIPSKTIPKKEIEKILLEKTDTEKFKKAILLYEKQEKVDIFISRIWDYAAKEIPDQNIPHIINALMDSCDNIPENTYSIRRIIFALLTDRFKTHEDRFDLLNNSILNAKNSIFLSVYCVYGLREDAEEKKNISEKTKITKPGIFTEKELGDLMQSVNNKVEEWIKRKNLLDHNNFFEIILYWRHWCGKDRMERIISKTIENDSNLVKFLKHFFNEKRINSTEQLDEIFNHLKKFVNLDEVDPRIRNIIQSNAYEEINKADQKLLQMYIDKRDGQLKQTTM